MFTYHTGNLFESTAEVLVNPVNCVGVMGLGLALQFKLRFYDNFLAYEEACLERKVKVGRMFTYIRKGTQPAYIVNFPTKIHWKDKSELSYINEGLEDLRSTILALGVKSVAIPRIGCGLGGLNWLLVRDLILKKLDDLEGIDIQIYS